MKNRNILFGYQYQNGNITVNQNESKTVMRVYQAYRDGDSLMGIAGCLNHEMIEYMPGITGWNKARVKRMIEDERYLGNQTYPKIINTEMFQSIQKIKDEKNTQKAIDRQADIFKINSPVICPVCGSYMSRRHDIRRKCQDVWTCKSNDCRQIVGISDNDMIHQITALLNLAISQPSIISKPLSEEIVTSMAVRKIENEIRNALDGHTINKDSLKEKMLECISAKYDDIDSTEHISEMLKADFEQQSLLTEFSTKLFAKAVTEIHLSENGKVSLILINGQEIGKENMNNDIDSNLTKESNIHSTHRNHSERKHKQISSDACGGILPSVNAG